MMDRNIKRAEDIERVVKASVAFYTFCGRHAVSIQNPEIEIAERADVRTARVTSVTRHYADIEQH
ncbi:hypothetical protein AcV5_002979 [Taiwanofungus camphoratus]|nr:hypothetical protein AcV5_002979 [Antrodia cinnamomea]